MAGKLSTVIACQSRPEHNDSKTELTLYIRQFPLQNKIYELIIITGKSDVTLIVKPSLRVHIKQTISNKSMDER